MAVDPSQMFQSLRPICTKIANHPTRADIQSLQSTFDGLDPGHLGKLTEYVLFPLKLILQRQGIASELKEDAVNCMKAFLEMIKVEKFSIFEDVFTVLTVLLSSKVPGQLAVLSEELKLSIVNCLSSLVDSTALVIRGVMYGSRFLPALGHAISLILVIAEQERARNLRVIALELLRKLAFCDNGGPPAWYVCNNKPSVNHLNGKGNSDLVNLTNHVLDDDLVSSITSEAVIAYASFLPGITMTLCRIVSGDPQQGHTVLTSVLDVFRDIVSMVLNDANLAENNDKDSDFTAAIASMCLNQQSSDCRPTNQKEEKKTSYVCTTEEHYKAKQLRIHQTKVWFTSTATKLKILIEKICSTTLGHSNWKVRLSLVNLCRSLLMNCSRSLQDSLAGLVDVLVGLSEDEFPQVASHSKSCLKEFSSMKLSSGPTSLISILEENLHSLLTALPRLMRTADDVNKLRTLNLVNGYIELLGDRIKTLLVSSPHLKRLSHAFAQVLEFDVSDVRIVEEQTPSHHESAVQPSETQGLNPLSFPAHRVVTNQFPRYRFKHFKEDKIEVALATSCQLLGCYGDMALLVDHFVDLFQESRVHQKQTVFMLNEIVLGFSGLGKRCSNEIQSGLKEEAYAECPNDSLHTAVELLLPVYTANRNWNVPTSSAVDVKNIPNTGKQELILHSGKSIKQKRGMSFEELNSNIHLVCLLLEGIGTFSRVLGKEFEGFLIETLYLVLSKLGDDNAAVSRAAYGTSLLICQSLGYASVDELISHNADYLVNSISLDFKFVFVNRTAPRVLQVMIQYSNADILAIIEDTLGDVFAVMDLYPDDLIYALIKVLYTLVCAISKWFVSSVVDDVDDVDDAGISSDDKLQDKATQHQTSADQSSLATALTETKSFAEEMFKVVMTYYKSKLTALGEVDCDDMVSEEDVCDDMVSEEDEGKEDLLYTPDEKHAIPTHVNYITQVLEKCIHFLASKAPVVRLLVLDTVAQSVLSIQLHQNNLLPMIHRVWPPLSKRLKDTELVVVIKAVDVVCVMAECSGEFIRRRVINDVFPVLLVYLQNQSAVSLKAGQVYMHSHAYKLQMAALEGLGRLCKQLNINEAELDHVCNTCALYLSSRQPLPLQQACISAYENFLILEPDAVWLTLNQLYCPVVPSPPHAMFKSLSFGTSESIEFVANVMHLLSKLA